MIDSLEGRLASKTPTTATVEVGGLGYLVHIPLSTFAAIAEPGERVRLFTHLRVSEDELKLYGFATEVERDLFLTLLGVNRVGPAVAMKVLSSCSVQDFFRYVQAGDVKALATLVKGVGKKTAQRLILELKGELAEAEGEEALAEESPVATVAIKALISLGETPSDARKAVKAALERLGPNVDQETLMREVLSA
jgi:Holliday junction DNA helicase RuvA